MARYDQRWAGDRDHSAQLERPWGKGAAGRDSDDARESYGSDSFTAHLDLPRGHERELAIDRERVYEFSGSESRALATVGAFRVAGIAHGQKTHDFIEKLLLHEFAREIRPGALHRGRLYHVHAKRLYAAIGEIDNRNRKPAPRGRLVERLMLLDAVLDDREHLWLGTETDKWRYVVLRCREHRLEKKELPHVVFGKGAAQTVRLFPDKLPIGVVREGDRHVFVYLARRRSPVDLQAFLVRHAVLLKTLHRWTIRVLIPKPFAKALALYKRAVFGELARPLHPSEADELGWFFKERERGRGMAAWVPDARFAEVRRRFNSPRFRMLHRLWQQYGENVLWDAKSTILADQLERDWGGVESFFWPGGTCISRPWLAWLELQSDLQCLLHPIQRFRGIAVLAADVARDRTAANGHFATALADAGQARRGVVRRALRILKQGGRPADCGDECAANGGP